MAQFMDIRKMKSFKLNSGKSKEGAPKVEYRAPLSFETIIHRKQRYRRDGYFMDNK